MAAKPPAWRARCAPRMDPLPGGSPLPGHALKWWKLTIRAILSHPHVLKLGAVLIGENCSGRTDDRWVTSPE